MATSQNGWPVLEDRPPSTTIPGTDIRLALLPGDVSFLLTRVAAYFHVHIERLDMLVQEEPGVDDWGWAYRAIRGQTTGFSNHASGTAEDLNATQHPRGVKNTFSDAEKRAMHAHLLDYRDPATGDKVIRWGEDYSGTIDGMHFEIVGSPAAVARVAARLRELDRPPDPLEDIMALDPAARAALIRDIADAVRTDPVPLMPYLRTLYTPENGAPPTTMPFADLAQHGAGQAKAALLALQDLADTLNAVLVELRKLTQPPV